MTAAAAGGPVSSREPAALAAVLLGALVYTLLNALKPLHVDDPFTWYVSQQIVRAPLDPYGFEIFWYQWPQPCSEDLLAPVVAYWGALGLLLSGANDFLWKLTLLPLAALFAVSFHRLAQRFTPGLETSLTLLLLFSPAFLPSMNYMQDVPALAFGLAALALYLRAEERGALGLALAAGLLAGVAMQTKYTAFSIPAAIGLHALLAGRLRCAVATGLAALAVFAAWEAYTTAVYGAGMFAANIAQPVFWSPRSHLLLPGLQLLGAVLIAFALLALAALGLSRAAVAGLAALVLAGHAALLAWPVEVPLYTALGGIVLATLVAVAIRLLRDGSGIAGRRAELFLIGWLLLEAVSYFEISYFPAIRRVLPLCIPAALLLARAAARAGRARLALWPVAALQLALALATWGVDVLEARALRDAARDALAVVRARDATGEVWFVGHWGFQPEAERLGMRPLIPDYSELRRGDWLVLPSRVDQQVAAFEAGQLELVATRSIRSVPPLHSIFGIYRGSTPLQHSREPRIVTRVFRVREPTVPASGWSVQQSADWALRAGGRQAGWARRALARDLERNPKPASRRLAAQALAALGPLAVEVAPALERAAAADPDPGVREAALAALARVRSGAS